ncbi:uncharacterized protein F5147DRAFT_652926 [Suillus discolor]|uniref:Uncharacterized protein n=1 Tax=Suillus discolor TaxID=1912936 RepID=A0A9P7JUA4_9AGAM|nr:uncharacterized protein F5147DRAFT_652926 [Suillus discolor]KAG2108204.1 hypothetical protein F5147DRAFT_652926 [Suillus discolor]
MSSFMKCITNEIKIDGTTYKDEEDLDIANLQSPTLQSIMHQDMQELQVMLDHVWYQRNYLQWECKEVQRWHKEQVEQICSYIDLLEEEVHYWQTIIHIISDDVDHLKEETEQQWKEIDVGIKQMHLQLRRFIICIF